MTKFEYTKNGTVSIARAKKARRVVLTAKGLTFTLPPLAAVALVMFTPVVVWGPILGMGGLFGTVALIIFKGEDVLQWYNDQKRYYREAKEYGVRDE